MVFRNPVHAESALNALQGFRFMGKPIRIEAAKSLSYAKAIDEGRFVYKDYKKQRTTRKTGNSATGASKDWTNILLVEDLPSSLSNEMLTFLFRQYPGFKSSRLIADKQLGFVEYDSEVQASIALNQLNGFKMTEENILKVSYAKRGDEASK